MRKTIGLVTCIFASLGLSSVAKADVAGTWATVEGKSHVLIAPCDGDKFCGTITWLKVPNNKEGNPKKDINNENEKLRERGILGIKLLKGLEMVGDSEWDDGQIYNPEDGQIYSSEMKLMDDKTLQVKGCVLFFCKEQIWTRVE